jgi:hypothetical protein
MNQRLLAIASLGVFSIGLSMGLSWQRSSWAAEPTTLPDVQPVTPTQSAPEPSASPAPQLRDSPGMQKLMSMFSEDIKATLNACRQQGGVNLAAGAQANGSVLCANGEAQANTPYDNYLTTVADVMAAMSLVGLKTVMASNPNVTPEMMVTFLSSPNGSTMLRSGLQSAIARSQFLPTESTESIKILVEQVLGRLVPTMQSTNNLTQLVGTTEQYGQVVSSFCTTPGMSIAQAQQTIPGLSSIQLYAVCVQESGLAQEVQQAVNRRSQS